VISSRWPSGGVDRGRRQLARFMTVDAVAEGYGGNGSALNGWVRLTRERARAVSSKA
jgi:transposase-like protein